MTDKPMRIAICCPRFLWAGGGSVDHARRLGEELQELGHKVSIYCDASDKGTVDTVLDVIQLPRDRSVEIRAQKRLDFETVRGFYRLANWMNRSGRNQLVASGPWCYGVAEPATFGDADIIVLLNAASAWTLLFGVLVKQKRKALTVVMPLFHTRETSALWPIHRRTLQEADVINTSTSFENEWLSKRGWPEKKLHAIGPAADPSSLYPNGAGFRQQYRIPMNAKVVLFLGRKVWNKGVIHVVQAMETVWEEDPEAVLVLMGFAHNTNEWLRGYTKKASGCLININNANEQLREDALSACDVMAAPSISDSFGIVYLDAWRHRKPVIACKNTACASVVRDGLNGYLVEFGAVPEIGKALLEIFRSPETSSEMGRAGHELWQERYTWKEVARRTEALYRKALEESSQG